MFVIDKLAVATLVVAPEGLLALAEQEPFYYCNERWIQKVVPKTFSQL